MIQRCRACGCCAGGLVFATIPMDPWPEPDLCRDCAAKGITANIDEEELVRSILERARREVAPVVLAEREGERITAEVMEMRLQ